MAIFVNPNSPNQPQAGVYGWFAQKDGAARIAIYIGMAGQKRSIIPKGTLFRGVSELQRNTFTSNAPHYNSLDTDFIVGTAVRFFEQKGFLCAWEHLCNDPARELDFVVSMKPILQGVSNSKIRTEFRLCRDETGYWHSRKNSEGVDEAERGIFFVLESVLTTQQGRF